MAFVEKLLKRAHFISLTSAHKSEEIAEVLYKEINKHCGLPQKNSDRDSRFASKFETKSAEMPTLSEICQLASIPRRIVSRKECFQSSKRRQDVLFQILKKI